MTEEPSLKGMTDDEKLEWFVNGEWREELPETSVSEDVDELYRVVDGE